MHYAGDPNIPVANVHYDLDVLDTVGDPEALKQEEHQILEYVPPHVGQVQVLIGIIQNHAGRESEDGSGGYTALVPSIVG